MVCHQLKRWKFQKSAENSKNEMKNWGWKNIYSWKLKKITFDANFDILSHFAYFQIISNLSLNSWTDLQWITNTKTLSAQWVL